MAALPKSDMLVGLKNLINFFRPDVMFLNNFLFRIFQSDNILNEH